MNIIKLYIVYITNRITEHTAYIHEYYPTEYMSVWNEFLWNVCKLWNGPNSESKNRPEETKGFSNKYIYWSDN